MRPYFLLFNILLCAILHAQQAPPLQVITKTIEDTYAYKIGTELAVEGQKAEIFVETWSKPQISIKVEMVAKHKNVEQAKKDLENLAFSTEKAGLKIFLKNSLIDPEQKSVSELRINYYIFLPEECPVYMKTYFGTANISNLNNRLRINGEYSQININNVQGLMDIRTRFGDIFGEKLDGNVVINSRRSDIELLDVAGTFLINAQYGELRFSPNARLADLRINADKSEVYIYDPIGSNFNYTLLSSYGDLQYPTEIPITVVEDSERMVYIKIPAKNELAGQIRASVAFGKLHLHEQAKQVARRKNY